jgi:hypothetical protein
MNAEEPLPEHQWLRRLVGEWVGDGNAAEAGSYAERVDALGEFWVIARGRGEFPGGGEMRSVMTLGYDPKKKRYTGTWVGSMMTFLWQYDGAVSADGQSLTLDSLGPDFEGNGALVPYRDVIEFDGDDRRTLRSLRQQGDGSWEEFMALSMRRAG